MTTATLDRLGEQAAAAADAAAIRAGIEIVPITTAEAAHRAARLLSEIWAVDEEQPIVAPEIIRALTHVNGYGAMAASGPNVVGAALGFFGCDEHGFHLHSYVAGVLEGLRGSNVGFALKQHQRAWALRRGLTKITWTFDPLVRRNAYFNLVKLGASAVGYEPDFYGTMHDGVNAGDLSDRIVIEWNLDSPRAVEASGAGAWPIDLDAIAGPDAVVRLRVGARSAPEVFDEAGAVELIQVPEDIVAMRADDAGLGRRWRLAIRETLGAALDAGGRAEGFTRDGWYVLRRPVPRAGERTTLTARKTC